MYIISSAGIIISLSIYFLSISFSNYYNHQAQQLLRQHEFQQANEIFLKAQKLAPLMDNPLFSHADMLRHGANSLLQANKQKQAELLFNLALVKLAEAEKRNPLRPQIYHIRGLIYEKSDIEEAKRQFAKALKLDPRFLFSRIQLAILLHQQGQLKQALEVLYQGVNYTYPTNKVMLEYMQTFANYSREAGVESFALHLESNIKRFFSENQQK
jgi:tetratricopeptide (TPR) repeat protein